MQRLDQKSQKKSKKVKKAKSHRVTKKIFGQNSQSHESRYLSQKSKSRSKSQSHFCDLTDFSISCTDDTSWFRPITKLYKARRKRRNIKNRYLTEGEKLKIRFGTAEKSSPRLNFGKGLADHANTDKYG